MSRSEAVAPAAPDDVLAAVRDAVVVVLELPADRVTAASRWTDLGADSLALVEIAEIVEQRLGQELARPVRIPDEELAAFATVGDAVAYLVAGTAR